jgi:hypothetical protein
MMNQVENCKFFEVDLRKCKNLDNRLAVLSVYSLSYTT